MCAARVGTLESLEFALEVCEHEINRPRDPEDELKAPLTEANHQEWSAETKLAYLAVQLSVAKGAFTKLTLEEHWFPKPNSLAALHEGLAELMTVAVRDRELERLALAQLRESQNQRDWPADERPGRLAGALKPAARCPRTRPLTAGALV